MVCQKSMWIISAVPTGINMDCHSGKLGLGVQERMTDLFADLVALAGGKVLIDRDMQLGMQLMPNPAHAHIMNIHYPCKTKGLSFDPINHLWVNRIHQPTPHGHHGIFDNEENGNGNEQSNDWISKGKTEEASQSPKQHRQGGQPIHTSRLPIGDKGRRANLFSAAHT